MRDWISDAQLIRWLEDRGYVVRHRSEARQPLSWNRTAPIPDGIDFKAEAVEKLRGMITQEHVRFHIVPGTPPPAKGLVGMPDIHRAVLLVL